jgi:hypothetical protein
MFVVRMVQEFFDKCRFVFVGGDLVDGVRSDADIGAIDL